MHFHLQSIKVKSMYNSVKKKMKLQSFSWILEQSLQDTTICVADRDDGECIYTGRKFHVEGQGLVVGTHTSQQRNV